MWFSVNHKLWKLSNSEHFFEFVNSCFVVHMSSKLLTLPVLKVFCGKNIMAWTNKHHQPRNHSFFSHASAEAVHAQNHRLHTAWLCCGLILNHLFAIHQLVCHVFGFEPIGLLLNHLLFVCHVYSPTISATASTWVCWSRCAAIDTRNTCVMTWPAYRKNVWKRYGTFMPWWSVTFAGVIHWPCQSGYDDIYKYIVYIIKGCCINASISV